MRSQNLLVQNKLVRNIVTKTDASQQGGPKYPNPTRTGNCVTMLRLFSAPWAVLSSKSGCWRIELDNKVGKQVSIIIYKLLSSIQMQTWNLSKILHRRIFRLKILHRQFHLILTVLVRKNTKNEWKWRNLHRWQKFYTAAGTDGMDKFHLCMHLSCLATQ